MAGESMPKSKEINVDEVQPQEESVLEDFWEAAQS
jgi:hypothetical protein